MPSCIHTDIILDGIINKLQCSVFYMKKAINRVYGTLCDNLNFRQEMVFRCYICFWYGYFKKRW